MTGITKTTINMKNPTFYRWLAGAALLGMAALLSAQAPVRQKTDGNLRPFWKCRLPAGTFLIPIDRISNVSTHQYVVQGAGRVWEMVLADSSSSIARFYYMEPASSLRNPATGDATLKYTEDALDQAAKATNSEEIWRRVVKEYPHATHAHTVEYRLEDIETMQKIYSHLSESWTSGKGGEVQVGNNNNS